MSDDSQKRREASARDLEAAGGWEAPLEIVPYDPEWRSWFTDEAERLRRTVPGLVLHHVGSTAVPGLAAKPIIDLMARVDDLDAPVTAIIAAGYQYPEAYNAVLRGRRWFCRPSAAVRTHHLHLVVDRAELDRHLRFRDALRQCPNLADEYANLKRHLVRRHANDREGYSAAKSAFIERVEGLAS